MELSEDGGAARGIVADGFQKTQAGHFKSEGQRVDCARGPGVLSGRGQAGSRTLPRLGCGQAGSRIPMQFEV